MNTLEHKSGYVALVGRPNAGKSTLLNRLLGTKLAAVTPRPQTTRNRIFGIFDREDAQIVFQDTPGLLDAKDAMHEFMMREAVRALEDSDVIVWLIDGIKGVTPREHAIAEKVLVEVKAPMIIAFNKMDVVPLDKREAITQSLQGLEFRREPKTHYLSALEGSGVDELLQEILSVLKPGPKFFPPDQLSDRATRFFMEEIIREKAFLNVQEEIPYSLAVKVETMKERENGLTAIQATIHVERDSQKGIILGKKGAMIKQIGTEARKDIEEFLGCKVFLELFVKVSEHWRKRTTHLRDFGYME